MFPAISMLTLPSQNKINMSNDNTQRVTLFVNSDLVKHAKTQAILEDITLTELVEKALIKYLPKETVIKKPNLKSDE